MISTFFAFTVYLNLSYIVRPNDFVSFLIVVNALKGAIAATSKF